MIRVTCAIICKNKKVLLALRGKNMSPPHQWEFPGGKLQEGETAETCLEREIAEELSVPVDILYPLQPVIYAYPDFTIELIPFVCAIRSGEPVAIEHATIEWVNLNELLLYDLAPADIPVAEAFIAQS